MKNVKKIGKLRFMIYGGSGHYVGVCFELGLIEEAREIEELAEQLKESALALLEAVAKNNLDSIHLNKRVALKYYFYWYLLALFNFGNIKEIMREQRSMADFFQTPKLATI